VTDLRITLVQTALHWEDPVANRAMLEEKIGEMDESTDVIVLPELFTTGFTMNAAPLAEPPDHTTTRWMRQQAARTGAVVTGSFIVRDGGNFYNRLLWMQPDGRYHIYDKRHCFRMGGEHEVYTPGTRRLVVEWKGWRICPLICYDLRFPVWSRNTPQQYDLLLYVANWPAVRSLAWNTLLAARAIENVCYVVGLNRVGEDGYGVPHSGDSAVLNFKGERLTYQQSLEVIHTETLNLNDLSTFRAQFPAHLDADSFTLT
jgi:predicted amidohydrolase